MSEHFPRATVSVAAWCNKCRKQTQHQVADRRKGSCLDCMAKLDREHAVRIADAQSLVGKFVNFFVGCENATPILVTSATAAGYVMLQGRNGIYQPGIFVVVDPPTQGSLFPVSAA